MLENVRSFRLGYFDTDDNIAPTTASVKKVMLSGTLQRSFAGLANTDFLVSAVVVMRSKPGSRL